MKEDADFTSVLKLNSLKNLRLFWCEKNLINSLRMLSDLLDNHAEFLYPLYKTIVRGHHYIYSILFGIPNIIHQSPVSFNFLVFRLRWGLGWDSIEREVSSNVLGLVQFVGGVMFDLGQVVPS